MDVGNLGECHTAELSAYVKSLPRTQLTNAPWHRNQASPCAILLKCNKCNEYLPFTSFYKMRHSSKGRKTVTGEKRNHTCTPCIAQAYQDSSTEQKMYYAAKRRAAIKNIEFDITVGDIKIPEYCPALGIKLQPVRGITGSDCSPSLDRIDSSRGYTRDNIAVISYRANTLKNNSSPDELRAIADWMEEVSA